ncbi:MAG TPA: prenyltransferase/squalene oxidase repeat-containing protein [Gemmataceae bacterium]|jgi:squalene-hopene/tetraprenyl-beta-curcumene cyclase
MRRFLPSVCLIALAYLASSAALRAETPDPFPKPKPNSADEPLAKSLSLAASARFLDAASVNWTRDRKCATCHTNVAYLLARPALKDSPSEGMAIVRRFFEDRVAHWDDEGKAKPKNDSEVVVTAVALAANDARTTGKLHPLTRKALDRIWTRQRADGAWEWEKCTWPPLEHDDYFGAVLAAVGVSLAPDGYARSDAARQGIDKLKQYLRKTPAPNLHHKTWLLWASAKLEGLMTADERRQTVKELLAAQRGDGGWSLPSLGDWEGFDGRENDTKAPSDGYGTGLTVYVLRQAGAAAKDESIRRGVRWLETNQRVSGRWFTRSLNTDRAHYITNAGTAFAVLALQSCAEK